MRLGSNQRFSLDLVVGRKCFRPALIFNITPCKLLISAADRCLNMTKNDTDAFSGFSFRGSTRPFIERESIDNGSIRSMGLEKRESRSIIHQIAVESFHSLLVVNTVSRRWVDWLVPTAYKKRKDRFNEREEIQDEFYLATKWKSCSQHWLWI